MEIKEILDQVKFGDTIKIVRVNLNRTRWVTLEGPALVNHPTVAIDLLDGTSHIIRYADGQTYEAGIEVLQLFRDGEIVRS